MYEIRIINKETGETEIEMDDCTSYFAVFAKKDGVQKCIEIKENALRMALMLDHIDDMQQEIIDRHDSVARVYGLLKNLHAIKESGDAKTD